MHTHVVGTNVKEATYHYKKHNETGVQSLAGENRIPHVVEQLSPCATTIEA